MTYYTASRSYGTQFLTVTSPPQSFTEVVTLSQVKQFLNLPERSPVDSAEDALLTRQIIAARNVAEKLQHRDLVVKQYDFLLDDLCCDAIEVEGPLIGVDLFNYRDSDGNTTALVADTEYIVDTARNLIMPAYNTSWPSFTAWPSSAVLLRFRAGLAASAVYWSNEGTVVIGGMLELISHWYHGRLPYEPTTMPIQEYPWSVQDALRFCVGPMVF